MVHDGVELMVARVTKAKVLEESNVSRVQWHTCHSQHTHTLT